MFRALICPSSGARDYTWDVTAYGGVVGGQEQGSRLCVRDEGNCSGSYPAPDRRPPATKPLHTICGTNISIVSSSWWWAHKCPKHVISAMNHSVASSWFIIYAYTTMRGQTDIKLTGRLLVFSRWRACRSWQRSLLRNVKLKWHNICCAASVNPLSS